MSFKPYTEKIKKKKIGICSILGRIRIRIRIRIQNRTRTRIRIHHPESGSADPDPHQNDTDPKHCRGGKGRKEGKKKRGKREEMEGNKEKTRGIVGKKREMESKKKNDLAIRILESFSNRVWEGFRWKNIHPSSPWIKVIFYSKGLGTGNFVTSRIKYDVPWFKLYLDERVKKIAWELCWV